jgi:hypothetical protein
MWSKLRGDDWVAPGLRRVYDRGVSRYNGQALRAGGPQRQRHEKEQTERLRELHEREPGRNRGGNHAERIEAPLRDELLVAN